MRFASVAAPAALAAGVLLIVLSVVEGGASVALFVFVPVVTGSSLAFLLGVALLLVGMFSLPFAIVERWEEEPGSPGPTPPMPAAQGQGGVGGFVLIGPVPIVFGSWKNLSRRARGGLALLGALLLIFVLVVFAWVLR